MDLNTVAHFTFVQGWLVYGTLVMTSTYLLIVPIILLFLSKSVGSASAFPDSYTDKDPFFIEGRKGTRSQCHVDGAMREDHLAELIAVVLS